jgi:hypothetical protein
MEASDILAVGAPELMAVLIVLCVVVFPLAGVAFARSGRRYDEIGKGRFSVDFADDAPANRDEEVRQLVEAKAYRQAQRGEAPVDVDSEVDRLLSGGPEVEDAAHGSGSPDPELAQIREEIRQVVIAANDRRERRGEPPLDVEAEVDRRLAEFG